MRSIEEFLKLSVSELKASLPDDREVLSGGLLDALETDARAGVRSLAARIRARQSAERAEERRLERLLKYETELWEQGYELIAGVDEAGVGPMAGPVVAGAAILPRDYKLRELNDSKKLDEPTRDRLAVQIKAESIAWSVGIAEVEEIDELNIYHAGLLAMRRAVENLHTSPHFVLVDARTIPGCSVSQRGIVKGDQLSASIAAASIIAKTTRDTMMVELDRRYPGYGLAIHKGYPTPAHFRVLRELGASPIHRRSYKPVQEALQTL